MKDTNYFTVNEDTQLEIIRKMEDLKCFCSKNKLPMLAAVPFKNSSSDTKYHVELLSPKIAGVTLTKDSITPYLLAINEGFRMVPDDGDSLFDEFDGMAEFEDDDILDSIDSEEKLCNDDEGQLPTT